MRVYRVDIDKIAPVPVEWDENSLFDADHYVILRSRHFRSEAKAWDALVAKHVVLAASARREARRAAEEAERAESLHSQAEENHRRWQQKQEG